MVPYDPNEARQADSTLMDWVTRCDTVGVIEQSERNMISFTGLNALG